MLPFACTVLLSSFLLFLVEPMIAKAILPWFGGTSAVWTTCMVFFQVLLPLGYCYSHLAVRKLAPKRQATLHVVLLVLSLAVLPITPPEWLEPTGGDTGAAKLLLLLVCTAGLPYLLLATTAPLMQRWMAASFPERQVYRLFAWSNFGSLVGLLSFPFLIERIAPSTTQLRAWSAAYAGFVVLCSATVWRARATTTWRVDSGESGGVNATAAGEPSSSGQPSIATYAVWLVLPAASSVLLLSTTQHLTQNVAPVPFLWVVPLAAYLLSFVFAFEGRGGKGLYEIRWVLPLTLSFVVAMAAGLSVTGRALDVSVALFVDNAGLFFACLFCHGELALRKPAARYLTHFYLTLAVGGALGGLAIGVVSPLILPGYFELCLILMVLCALAIPIARRHPHLSDRWAVSLSFAGVLSLFMTVFYGMAYFQYMRENTILMRRNFYGSLLVKEMGEEGSRERRLLHGVIVHGRQLTSGPTRMEPTAYYSRTSGIGLAIAALQSKRPIRMALLGLGVGTLCAYGREEDTIRVYEIDPDIVSAAKEHFTYISGSKAKVDFVLGDGRLSLERELRQKSVSPYDIIVLDAFSGDSIPVHLLTREAFGVYLGYLARGGILAVHITNQYLNLRPMLANVTAELGLESRLVVDQKPDRGLASTSHWVLVARDKETLESGEIPRRARMLKTDPSVSVWTDQFSNLLEVSRVDPIAGLRGLFRAP